MRDGRFSLWVTSKAKRGKQVNSLELIRFKIITFVACLLFFFLEHLRVHLFCFSFHVEECIIGERTHFTPNTCANKDIQLHQYETRVFDF